MPASWSVQFQLPLGFGEGTCSCVFPVRVMEEELSPVRGFTGAHVGEGQTEKR